MTTNELLSGLSPAEAERVLALGTRMTLPSGATLFRLGDPADRLFLTERGRIRLTLPLQIRGREEDILIEEKTPGQTVGWSALIPPYRFTLSATAPVETEVIALPREALRSYFETTPAVGYKITSNLAAVALLTYFAGNPAAGYKIALNLAVVVGHRLQLFQTMWLREVQRTVELRSA
jgi:CRP-like cAMP-binding protein